MENFSLNADNKSTKHRGDTCFTRKRNRIINPSSNIIQSKVNRETHKNIKRKRDLFLHYV